MARANVLGPLRWKRAKIHRGSRRRNIGPHHEAGYTSAVVTEPESVKAVAIGRGPYTSTYDLNKLLDDCHRGVIQLPDFQRSWVWDEDRIKSLIASVSRAFPVGALMSLDTGGPVNFKPRP